MSCWSTNYLGNRKVEPLTDECVCRIGYEQKTTYFSLHKEGCNWEAEKVIRSTRRNPESNNCSWPIRIIRRMVDKIIYDPSEYRHCICDNEECEEGRLLAKEILPSDHVWCANKGFVEIKHSDKNNPTEKVEALCRSCVKHLSISEERAFSEVYYVARIHWPESVLKTRGYLSTPIANHEEAQELDKAAGYSDERFAVKRNSFGEIMKEGLRGRKLKRKYVVAPVHRNREVIDYLTRLSSSRSLKRSNEESPGNAAIALSSTTKSMSRSSGTSEGMPSKRRTDCELVDEAPQTQKYRKLMESATTEDIRAAEVLVSAFSYTPS